ncbi:MAG: hypothetical protein R6V06_08350 [Kiritimatiellia bacterium]
MNEIKELIPGLYRKILNELTPSERKVILIILVLLVLGAGVEFFRSL